MAKERSFPRIYTIKEVREKRGGGWLFERSACRADLTVNETSGHFSPFKSEQPVQSSSGL